MLLSHRRHSGKKGEGFSSMFRSRDDRRRRAMAESGQSETVDHADTTARNGQGSLYSTHATDFANRPLRDFIPLTIRPIVGLVFGSITVIAVILLADYYQAPIRSWLNVDSLPALDLAQNNSFGHWFNGVGLTLCTLLSIFILSLRRHRLDDYRGHYRLWFLTSVMLAVVSVAAFVPLHELWQVVSSRLTNWTHPKLGHLLWSAPLALAQLALVIRLFMELQRCRFALACLLMSQVILTVALLGHTGLVKLSFPFAALTVHGLHMAGILIQGLGLLTYARHVLLEIDGVVKSERKAPRIKEKKKGFWERRRERKLRVDDAHEKNEKSDSKLSSSKVVKEKAHAHATSSNSYASYSGSSNSYDDADSEEEDSDDDDSSSNSSNKKMSRAERKALRKQQKSDRRKDEDWE